MFVSDLNLQIFLIFICDMSLECELEIKIKIIIKEDILNK